MAIDDALAQLGPSIKYYKIEETSSSGNYILLPGNDYHEELLISKERKYFGKNWHQSHEELQKENLYMLTIREFVDFLKLLKSGNVCDENKNKIPAEQCNSILDDILAQRNPYRGEWLNAMFKQKYESLEIIKFREGQQLQMFLQNDYLNQDKVLGISLDYWLANPGSHGLPQENNLDGNLFYYSPRKDHVTWFWAGSDCVRLDCYVVPRSSYSRLGVRPVKIPKK